MAVTQASATDQPLDHLSHANGWDVAFGRLDLDWQRYVEIDPRYFRPSEVDELRGDMTRARRLLKWEPKLRFRPLIEQMVDHDLADLLRHRQTLPR